MALTKVTSGVRTLATDEVGATEIAAGAVGASEVASTIDLSSKTVTLPPAAVTTHVTQFDDKNLRNDISTLALHSAIADNKAAHNLSNSFIDQFEDDTGLDVQTQVDNTSEYMASVYSAAPDSNTKLLMHMDGNNGGTTFTDSSGTSKILTNSNVTTTTADKKFGSASADATVNQSYIYADNHSDFQIGANASFTFDFWVKIPSLGANTNNRIFQKGNNAGDGFGIFVSASHIYFGWEDQQDLAFASNLVVGTGNWHHIAVVRNTQAMALYLDGVSKDTGTDGNAANLAANVYFFTYQSGAGNSDRFNGYMDEFRFSNVARWTSGFTPETAAYGTVVNATGNFTSANQTAVSSVSSMGIVVLYKDHFGTASLNTDLVCEISANGGTNYSTATLVAGGTFSTGIKIAAVSGVAVTAGTVPKYKISFANQVAASKETQVHGAALLY